MKELADVAKKYGKPRRCEIMYEVPAAESEEPEQQIPDYPVHLFFTRDGYFNKPGDNLSLDTHFGIDGTGRRK